MIDDIRELEVLRGFRNLPRGDCEALAQAIRAMSLLAHIDSRSLSEAEINPLIVKAQGHGVVAVDGLVVFSECSGHSRISPPLRPERSEGAA